MGKCFDSALAHWKALTWSLDCFATIGLRQGTDDPEKASQLAAYAGRLDIGSLKWDMSQMYVTGAARLSLFRI